MPSEYSKKRTGEYRFWLIVFLINLLLGFLSVIVTIISGDGIFTLTKDFNGQEIPFYIFCNDAIKSGDIYWNWAIDLGSDFITSFSFYTLGSPFFWLTMLFPADAAPYVMGWVYMLKYAVAGLFAYIFIRRFTKNKYSALIGSMLYAFSGFQSCNLVFYHFHDVVAFFPLLLIGVEKLIEEKKHGFLAFAVFINAFINYFFFVGEVIFLIIYYVCRFIVPKADEWRKLFTKKNGHEVKKNLWQLFCPIVLCMVEGIIGIMMAGALFVPSIYFIMQGPKAADHIRGSGIIFFMQTDYLRLLRGMFFPADIMCANASLATENWMSNSSYLPMVGMFLTITYLCKHSADKKVQKQIRESEKNIYNVGDEADGVTKDETNAKISKKDKKDKKVKKVKKDWIVAMLTVCFVMSLSPLLNSIFVGFASEYYRRWFYMPVLIMAMIAGKVIEDRKEYSFKKPFIITMSIMLGFIALMTLYPWTWSLDYETPVMLPTVFAVLCATGIAGVVLTYLIITKVQKHYTLIFTIAVSVFAVFTTQMSLFLYKSDSQFENSAVYKQEVIDTANALEPDILPYRYYIFYHAINRQMVASLPSRNSFFTTMEPSITEFYDAIGHPRMNNIGSEGPEGTNELLSVKYYVIEEKPWPQEHKYMFNNGSKDIFVYEEENALPIGFTYDTYLTRSVFEEIVLEAEREKEELYGNDSRAALAMLRTLVIEDEDEEDIAKWLRQYNPTADGYFYHWQKSAIMDERRAESSENFWKTNKAFGSTIYADSEKLAFFSVPYSKNWSAKVNGEDVKIYKTSGLMSIPVSTGENKIEFTYENKSVKYGVVVTLIGFAAWVIYSVVSNLKRDGSF